MRPEQIALMPTVSTPSVHPSGRWAVASVTHPSLEADDQVGQLWRVPLQAGRARSGESPARITRGYCDTAPQVSPDGRLIAFLRRLPGHRPQLALVEAHGGEPWIITSFKQGVHEFSWSPDSSRIVLTARVPDPGRYGTVKGIDAGHEDPRRLTGVMLRHNGLVPGWYTDRPSQVFLLEVPDPDAEPAVRPVGRAAGRPGVSADDCRPGTAVVRALTEDHADWSSPVFLDDDSVLACRQAATAQGPGSRELLCDPVRIDIATLATHSLRRRHDTRSVESLTVSDGRVFALVTDRGPSTCDVAINTGVAVLDPAAPADLTPLTGPDTGLTDSMAPAPGGVLVADEFRGRGRLHLVGPSPESDKSPLPEGDKSTLSESDEILLDEDVVVTGAAAIPRSHDVVVSLTTPDSPGEVAIITGGRTTVLTDFAADLHRTTGVTHPEELTAATAEGPVHGWVLTPPGPGPHPVILMIHGGPHSQYTGSFFDEFQVMTGAGYAVVACNPRGSSGYGQDHARALVGRFGQVDADDVMAFLDAALDTHPDLDRTRIGIMGGSYGGYLTAWIIGHDGRWGEHHWRGAIVERGYLDPPSFVGASDIGWYYPQRYNGESRAAQESQSAMRVAEQVTTPTLVIHSEQDLRTPFSQGLEYHARLAMAGVETELLAFPGENHELTRSGTPWHRRQRFEAILEFWRAHI
jgi:dipeptidyl aminopeptidase/acylaminoacyl peptidase